MGTEQTTTEEQTEQKPSEEKIDFLQEFEATDDSQKKLRFGIDSMRKALSQEGTPFFKEFWNIRKMCLPLFKESINPLQRKHLWTEYIELSNEARRLKEILDEQTNFTVEQIDLAITSLEKDLAQYKDLLTTTPELDFPTYKEALKGSSIEYPRIQKELSFLNALALKINALRKELIKTEMRISQKNKFFKRLAKLGDSVFPKRKQQIQEVSTSFLQDVQLFVQRHFQEGSTPKAPYYILREEIKALQSMAKMITLHTSAFTQVRELLSKCWDQFKELDRLRKQQKVEKSESVQKATEEAQEKIAALQSKVEDPSVSLEELKQDTQAIFTWLETKKLEKKESISIRQNVQKVLSIYYDRQKKEKQKQAKAKAEENKQQLHSLQEEIQLLLTKEKCPKVLKEKHASYVEKAGVLDLKKLDREKVHRLLASIYDQYLSSVLQECLENQEGEELKKSLEKLLQEKKQRRQEIKDQVEVYRKAMGSSNCDMEQAMTYREMLDGHKSSLEKINESIEQIEEHLFDVEET